MGSTGSGSITQTLSTKYNISAEGVNTRVLQQLPKLLDRLYKELPGMKNVDARIVEASFKEKFPQYEGNTALSDPRSNAIYLNTDVDIYARYSQRLNEGFYPKGTTAANIIIHELAHKFQDNVASRLGLNNEDAARQVVTNAFNTPSIKAQFSSMEQAEKSISQYAGKGFEILPGVRAPQHQETVSEAISEYASNGNNSSDFTKAIIKQLKRK